MKRYIKTFSYFISILCFVICTVSPSYLSYAQDELTQEGYDEVLEQYDLSAFDELDADSKKLLDELGLTDFDYNTIVDFSFSEFFSTLKDTVLNSASGPLEGCAVILLIILLSALFQSFKETVNDSQMASVLSTVSAVIVALILISRIRFTISASCSAISVCADFVYAFIPAFCVIVAASGNTVAAFSTNTLLLSLAQILNFISKNIFIPLSNCFLALGICSGIRNELNLGAFISNMKKYLTTAISVCATAFVSILSIKTAVAARADAIGLRSVRFAINSVVPVIGGVISEGLLSIQAYSSLIRSSVGVVGIIAVALVFLPSILEVTFWRLFLSLCSTVSEIFSDRSVSSVIKAFTDALLIMNVILILSMVTTVISIGILIAARGSA
ncbi:MAG TPA: stage III sporulation protein AE [Candidatus Eubacterium faecavium]|nr:stage III sporulation protein AE [Candidatus Eubacterium faecavium]